MYKVITFLTLCTFACMTSSPYQVKTYVPLKDRPEKVTILPEDPEKMSPPEDLPIGEDVYPVDKDEICPISGILLSERQAWRYGQYIIAYKALRDVDGADRNVWGAHRLFYEAGMNQRDQKLEERRPDWWDNNKAWVGTILGFIGGAAVTVGIATAINETTN